MKHRLLAVLALFGLIVVATASPAEARGMQRFEFHAQNMVPAGIYVDETEAEIVSYVGTLSVGGVPQYQIAFFSPTGTVPTFDGWWYFEDRWEIYDTNAVILSSELEFADPVPLRSGDDRGYGHFMKNVFFGAGGGAFWYGSFTPSLFVDGMENPDATGAFEGKFWLFGHIGG